MWRPVVGGRHLLVLTSSPYLANPIYYLGSLFYQPRNFFYRLVKEGTNTLLVFSLSLEDFDPML